MFACENDQPGVIERKLSTDIFCCKFVSMGRNDHLFLKVRIWCGLVCHRNLSERSPFPVFQKKIRQLKPVSKVEIIPGRPMCNPCTQKMWLNYFLPPTHQFSFSSVTLVHLTCITAVIWPTLCGCVLKTQTNRPRTTMNESVVLYLLNQEMT